MELANFALSTITAFFAIMNPIANIPIFMGLVEGETNEQKRRISRTATTTAFAIGVAFILFGTVIFNLFGLTIMAFKIAGGILIFYVGFGMLQSKKSDIHDTTNHGKDDDSIAISPIAIPILAGPGTIVTAMNASSHATIPKMVIVIACFAAILLCNYIAFVNSERVVKYLGQNIIKVIGKIMGLILAIIGVNMAIEGVKLAFHV